MEKSANPIHVIRQMTERVGSAQTVEEALRWILELLAEIVPGDVRAFLLLDEDGSTLRVKAALGLDPQFIGRFEGTVGAGFIADVLWGGRVRALRMADPSSEEYKALRLDRAFKSGVAAPMGAAGHRVGYLWLQSESEDAYNLEHLNLAAIAANLAGEKVAHILANAECARHVPIDTQTGLLRHLEFERRLGVEIERARRAGSKVSVLLVHLEGFARLKAAGVVDETMRDMARLAHEELRGIDFLGRQSADRIEACLPDTGSDEALTAAKRLHEKLDGLRSERFAKDPVGVAIGVAAFPDDAADVRGLITCAGKSALAARRPDSGHVVRSSGRS